MLLFAGFLAYFVAAIHISIPQIKDRSVEKLTRETVAIDFYKVGHNWLKKSNSGLWEMYLEGDGFERGVINGKLTRELAEYQEDVFINQIKQLIPSEHYLNFLKYFVAYFNRHLPQHISDEYAQEIYGVSLSASDKYDQLAPKYYRILNYHSAHDIGHALQDKNMTVGCTSFGLRNGKTKDGKLLIGRNFDFFAGQDFAHNKIVCFTKPKFGNKFMYVTWAGFTGVVSGMNDKGLTVTINAAKSDIPSSAATPISLLAKEILQYAGTIEQAYAIAKKRQTFVSESILIGSAIDKKTASIEKTPTRIDLFEESGEQLICSNHFRGKLFEKDYTNNKNIVESSSLYRKFRVEELLGKNRSFSPEEVALILRNQDGLHGDKIGLSNEKGINQLIAHHSIIFKPEELLVWVSTSPFQLGEYVCYDLNKIFEEAPGLNQKKELNEENRTIAEDPFLKSTSYRQFLLFKQLKDYFSFCTKSDFHLVAELRFIRAIQECNPESYLTYQILGDYYLKIKNTEYAQRAYTKALTKEVATKKEADNLIWLINELDLNNYR